MHTSIMMAVLISGASYITTARFVDVIERTSNSDVMTGMTSTVTEGSSSNTSTPTLLTPKESARVNITSDSPRKTNDTDASEGMRSHDVREVRTTHNITEVRTSKTDNMTSKNVSKLMTFRNSSDASTPVNVSDAMTSHTIISDVLTSHNISSILMPHNKLMTFQNSSDASTSVHVSDAMTSLTVIRDVMTSHTISDIPTPYNKLMTFQNSSDASKSTNVMASHVNISDILTPLNNATGEDVEATSRQDNVSQRNNATGEDVEATSRQVNVSQLNNATGEDVEATSRQDNVSQRNNATGEDVEATSRQDNVSQVNNATGEDVEATLRQDNVSQPNNATRQGNVSALMTVTIMLMAYVTPVTTGLGFLGNAASMVVFMSSEKMRRVSTNIYLAALSASNSVFLLAVAVSWTDFLGLNLMHRPGLCQLTVYLTYVSGFLSVWLVVCITAESCIFSFFVHRASGVCTVRNSVSVTVLLTFTAFLLYDFALWTSGLVGEEVEEEVWEEEEGVKVNGIEYCATVPTYRSIVETFTFVDAGVTLVIPALLILALVVPTSVHNIVTRHHVRHRGGGGGGGQYAQPQQRRLSQAKRALVRVQRLLNVIIVSYVVMTAPTHVQKLRHLFAVTPADADDEQTQQQQQQEHSETDLMVNVLCQLLYYLSFSVNWVYFLIWGKTYRNRCRHLLRSAFRVFRRC